MLKKLPRRIHSQATGLSRWAPKLGLLLLLALACLGAGSFSPALAASPADLLDAHTGFPATSFFNPSVPDRPRPDGLPLPADRAPVDNPRLLLPDLLTLPPYHLEIVTLPDGSRELRLSNTIWNSGAGALELEGKFNPATQKTKVEQHVLAQVGIPLDHLVGEFIWHPTHDHWHFEAFSLYELWTLTPSGGLDTVISSSDKVSYCVIDTDIVDRQHAGFVPRKRYYGCGRALQGLSPGWGDTYKSFLDGQSIQLSGVKDGLFALKSTANPDAILLEANYHNNAALLYLDIRGERITTLSLEELYERRCQEDGWWLVPEILCMY